MAQLWKVKRELIRLVTQVRELGRWAGAWPNRWHYDRYLRPQIVRTEGSVPLQDDVAILLIYQPKQLLASLFFELDFLRSKGIATVLVANHSITPQDRERLVEYCHTILERPNVGYDFGGYREGVLYVLENNLSPKNLFILNDSMWFPLNRNCTLIDTARTSDADLFGIFFNTKNRKMKHHHLQSYFFRFNEKILTNPRFAKYWRGLPLFNTKRLVIRHCEIKLAGTFRSMGFTAEALFSGQNICDAALRLNDEELHAVAKYHATSTLRGKSLFKNFVDVPLDKKWRTAIENVIKNSRFRYYFIDAHPLVFLRELDAPFVKKSREYHYYPQRNELIDFNLHTRIDPIVRNEIESWNDQGAAGPAEDKSFPTI